jgi:phosphatidylethanolamine/phosphatidyl-N-methylethanolamine N-methyltransferase
MTPQTQSRESQSTTSLDLDAVKRTYKRYAPIYDGTFRWLLGQSGRKRAAELANKHDGAVLELGVGTGLTLPFYKRDHNLTGIDVSEAMLDKARKRARNMDHVRDLRVMDAEALEYGENSFDCIVAAYVMSVVPDIDTALREVERVIKPGGEVILINHFQEKNDNARARVEKLMTRFAAQLGWHPDFDMDEMLGRTNLELIQSEDGYPPLGLFTLLRLRMPESAQT